MKYLILTWSKLMQWLYQKPLHYKIIISAEIPDELKTRSVYLIGEYNDFWIAVLLCPCGCNDKIHLNLLDARKPYWCITQYTHGTFSIAPSIWKKSGCKSYFFISRNKIIWS